MTRLVAALALALWCLNCEAAGAQTFEDRQLGDRILAGVATHDRLWLLGSTGRVVAFDRTTGERRVVATGISYIAPDGDHLWSLSQWQGEDAPLLIRDLREPRRSPESLAVSGSPIGFHVHNGQFSLVTTSAVASRSGGRWNIQSIGGTFISGRGVLAADRQGTLFLGINYGEHGGGLRRVDPRSGKLVRVGGDDPEGPICGGALTACDAINGVIADPDFSGCVIVAGGNDHMISRGGIRRVCGDVVTVLHQETAADAPLGRPFDSLASTPTGWVAGIDGNVIRKVGHQPVEQSRPELRDWSGISVNDDQPDVIFVQSWCCSSSETEPYGLIVIPVLAD